MEAPISEAPISAKFDPPLRTAIYPNSAVYSRNEGGGMLTLAADEKFIAAHKSGRLRSAALMSAVDSRLKPGNCEPFKTECIPLYPFISFYIPLHPLISH